MDCAKKYSTGLARMKVYIHSMARGCVSSLLETSSYRNLLLKQGYEVIESVNEADAIVLNSCGFSSEVESEGLAQIDKYKTTYPDKRLIVGGCLTKINQKLLKEHFDGPQFKTEDMLGLLQALDSSKKHELDPTATLSDFEADHLNPFDLDRLSLKYKVFFSVRSLYYAAARNLHYSNSFIDNYFKGAAIGPDSVLIRAARGCLGGCTYCSIKKSRGSLVSTPLESIKKQITRATSMNPRDIVLCGEDLGAWGQDLGTNVSVLFSEVVKMPEVSSVIIPFFEPSWLVKYFDALKPLLSSQKFISIYIPIHSASQAVLDRMGRDYSTQEVLVLIRELKKSNPNLVIKTNILHSFPGEGWMEYFSSLACGLLFDFSVAIKFTPRPGTAAAQFDHPISPSVKTIRQKLGASLFLLNNISKLIWNTLKSSGRSHLI